MLAHFGGDLSSQEKKGGDSESQRAETVLSIFDAEKGIQYRHYYSRAEEIGLKEDLSNTVLPGLRIDDSGGFPD